MSSAVIAAPCDWLLITYLPMRLNHRATSATFCPGTSAANAVLKSIPSTLYGNWTLGAGKNPLLSFTYIAIALLMSLSDAAHLILAASARAAWRAGRRIAIRIAMIPMTTSSSTSVNARAVLTLVDERFSLRRNAMHFDMADPFETGFREGSQSVVPRREVSPVLQLESTKAPWNFKKILAIY